MAKVLVLLSTLLTAVEPRTPFISVGVIFVIMYAIVISMMLGLTVNVSILYVIECSELVIKSITLFSSLC